MKGNETLLLTARRAAEELSGAGKSLDRASTVTLIAQRLWKRHRETGSQGYARVTSTAWARVHPSWKSRYRNLARKGIDAYRAATQPTTQ